MTCILVLFCTLIVLLLFILSLRVLMFACLMKKPFHREGRAVQKEKLSWDQFQPVQWGTLQTFSLLLRASSAQFALLPEEQASIFLSFQLKAKGLCSTLSLPTNVPFALLSKSWALQLHSVTMPLKTEDNCPQWLFYSLSQVTFSFLVLITGHIILVGPGLFWGAQPGHSASLAAIWRE